MGVAKVLRNRGTRDATMDKVVADDLAASWERLQLMYVQFAEALTGVGFTGMSAVEREFITNVMERWA